MEVLRLVVACAVTSFVTVALLWRCMRRAADEQARAHYEAEMERVRREDRIERAQRIEQLRRLAGVLHHQSEEMDTLRWWAATLQKRLRGGE